MSIDRKGAYREATLETWKKYQNRVEEEHHQNFLNQERTGSIRKLIKKQKGRKRESVRITITYDDEDEVKAT